MKEARALDLPQKILQLVDCYSYLPLVHQHVELEVEVDYCLHVDQLRQPQEVVVVVDQHLPI